MLRFVLLKQSLQGGCNFKVILEAAICGAVALYFQALKDVSAILSIAFSDTSVMVDYMLEMLGYFRKKHISTACYSSSASQITASKVKATLNQSSIAMYT